jgi:hypothetical protein
MLIELLGDGTGTFQSAGTFKAGDQIASGKLANLDANPAAELFIAGFNTNTPFLKLFKAAPAGQWTEFQTVSSGATVWDFALQDLTGDPRQDLAVLETQESQGQLVSLDLFPGTPAGFGAAQSVVADPGLGQRLELADVDQDGLTDFVLSSAIYPAKSGGGHKDPLPFWIGIGGARIALDLNGDHRPDLLGWDESGGSISILFGR